MLNIIAIVVLGLGCVLHSISAQEIDVGTTLSTEYVLNTIWDSTTQTQTMVNSAILTTTHAIPTVTESFVDITTKLVPIPVTVGTSSLPVEISTKLIPFPVTLTASASIPTTFISSESVIEISTKLVPFPVTVPVTTSLFETATQSLSFTSIQNSTVTASATATIDHTTQQTETATQTEVQTEIQTQTQTDNATLTKTLSCPHQSTTFVSIVSVVEPTVEIQTQSEIITVPSKGSPTPQTISITNVPFTTTINEFTTIEAATSILTSLFITQVPSSINIFPTATLTEGGSVDSTSTIATSTVWSSATIVATPTPSHCNSSFMVNSTSKHYFLGTRSSRHCHMTEIESSLESAQVSAKICAPVFVKSWETNGYNGTCLALQPGGAGAIVPVVGGCNASLQVLCN